MRKICFGLVLLIVILVLSACARTQEFPTGEFYESTPGGSGEWILMADELNFTFSEDGTFIITNSSGLYTITGTYTVDGDKYTEVSTDLTSCSVKGPATYRWTFDGTTLKFFGIGEDKCIYRTNIMEGRELIRME
jgi:hypothetical protein